MGGRVQERVLLMYGSVQMCGVISGVGKMDAVEE